MKALIYSKRTLKELLRDPLSLGFSIGLPLVLLFLMTFIQNSVPEGVKIFELTTLTPGLIVFSFSFISLFSALLISKDRTSSFLTRLFSSPLTAADYICGYSLPLIPIALIQAVLCYACALILGLPFSLNMLLSLVFAIPVSVLFVAMGLLTGGIFDDKQVGIITSIVIQLCALSGGIWFDIKMIGGVFEKICYALPFANAVEIMKSVLNGAVGDIWLNLAVVLGYAVVVFFFAVFVFKRKMKQ